MERISNVRTALSHLLLSRSALRDEPDFEWRAEGDIHSIFSPVDTFAYDGLPLEISLGSADDTESIVPPDVSVVVEIAPEIDIDRARPLLSQHKAEEVQARTMATGIDALGWYMPFHQTCYQWGIYVNVTGISFLASLFMDNGIDPIRSIELATAGIIRHELVHFSVEYMISQIEISNGLECYWPSRVLKDANLGYNVREEQLANAYMLRRFRYPRKGLRTKGAFDALRKFTLSQPLGYRDGYRYVQRDKLERQMAELAFEYAQGVEFAYKIPRRGLDFLSLYAGLDPIDFRYCPIFLVIDDTSTVLSSVSIRLISCISEISETDGFVKSLNRLSDRAKREWEKTRNKLQINTQMTGLDFKKWNDNTWSVRVNRDIRAHLRGSQGGWIAESIGHHKEMGHG